MSTIVKTKDQAQELLRLIQIDIDHKRYQTRQERLDLEGFAGELVAWIEGDELPRERRNSEIYLWLTGSPAAVIGNDYGVGEMNQDQIVTQSPERLVHFQCPGCKGWWSIGDAPEREAWFCPWCGKRSLTKGGTVPAAITSPISHSQTSQEAKNESRSRNNSPFLNALIRQIIHRAESLADVHYGLSVCSQALKAANQKVLGRIERG